MHAVKKRYSQEPHGVTSQKTPFFIVTTVKTSNLKNIKYFKVKQLVAL
jgi:hypothetical protein